MQKIRSILKITSSGAELCDIYGSTTGAVLEIMSGTSYILEFELRGEAAGESAVLPAYPAGDLHCSACYCALDTRRGNRTDPPMLIFNGVTLAEGSGGVPVLTVPFNGNAAGSLAALLKESDTVELYCELGGFDEQGNAVFAWQFTLTLHSRVYCGSGSESVPDDPEFFTAVQVQAIASGLEKKIDLVAESIPGEVTSETLQITDSGNFFENSSVEAVLQEIGRELDGVNELLKGI